MSHGPATNWGDDAAAAYKSRTGIILFIIYGVIYGTFILINAVAPDVMGLASLGGLNVAIVYGFTLIFLAFLLGIVYHVLCHLKEKALNKHVPEKE